MTYNQPAEETCNIVKMMETLWPGSSHEEKERLLWWTSYKAETDEIVIGQLQAFKDRFGDNILDAINAENKRFDDLWDKALEELST